MILVIGCGSTLRTDDAIGHVVAQALSERFSADDVRVVTMTQLMPELSAQISRADHVIYIDADVGLSAGRVSVDSVMAQDMSASFTHHVSPESLLLAAGALYGRRPPAQIISVGADSFEIGLSLSPALLAQLPVVIAEAEKVVLRALQTLNDSAVL